MIKEPESFKENWQMLIPKVRDRWPKLTEDDIREIDGDMEALARKIKEHYGWTRADVMNELTALTQLARVEGGDVEAGRPKMSEAAEGNRTSRDR